MRSFKKARKVIAAFFLVSILADIFLPAASYALTAGPTAPEFSSFEPVDTTDMVNLQSGDFTYNLPLIEVPGPAGSYPLSLSYHAGIQPNEEASWVGLGFTLNPGSISRTVKGYPDDHKYVTNVDRAYWSGGSRTNYSVGVNIGIANSPASVGFGLSFSQDTYQGFGIGGYASVGGGFFQNAAKNLGLNTSFTMGVSPYNGKLYASSGLGVGIGNATQKAFRLGAGISYSNFGLSGSAGVNVGRFSLMGVSLASGGSGSPLSVGGANWSNVHNARAGSISTESTSVGIDVPITAGFSISLGYSHERYWSDETVAVLTNGVLYTPASPVGSFDNAAFDTYSLLATTSNMVDDPDPEKQSGGSLPSWDDYIVVAQGLSGAIRPYMYKGLIFRQNRQRNDGFYDVKQYPYATSDYRNDKIEFRFVNDFSNRYQYEGGDISQGNLPLRMSFDNSEVTGETGDDGISDNHLAGSRHIEWYTNSDLLVSGSSKDPWADGFIDCSVEGFDRAALPLDQIGGFKITNASGVTYHYALPVYAREEYVYSENINKDEGTTYNSLRRPEKYAYTWLLTAVSGPDYVDRNNNRKADEGDWGYWVEFNYSKHSDDYKWRNPSEGYHVDLDNNFKNYSSGVKEIYYLSYIRTETHVAVFEKSERLDGREVHTAAHGGFTPIPRYDENGQVFEYIYPEGGLKLDQIKLFNVDDYNAGRISNEYLLRSIGFNYSYSLAPETSNSFANDFDIEVPLVNFGKLTLSSVEFSGKKGISLVPPIRFEYDLNEFVEPGAGLELVSETTPDWGRISYNSLAKDVLEEGDIIRFTQGTLTRYAVVVLEAEHYYYVRQLGKESNVQSGGISNIYKTKNPPYQSFKYDAWNMYSPDIEKSELEKDENTERMTTHISARAVDAWSLRRIVNSLGSITEIEYESDDYGSIALNSSYQFFVTHASVEGDIGDSNTDEVTLWIEGKDAFKVNDMINFLFVYQEDHGSCSFRPIVWEGEYRIHEFNDLGRIVIKDRTLAWKLKYDPCNNGDNNFLGGHIGGSTTFRYGGGLRVKSISLISATGTRKTSYHYERPGGGSSGVTSYEPFTYGGAIKKHVDYKWEHFFDGYDPANGGYDDYEYNKRLYRSFSNLMAVAREVPPPGVMYEYVTVRESQIHPDGHEQPIPEEAVYHFDVFRPGHVKVQTIVPETNVGDQSGTYDGINYSRKTKKTLAIKDFTSRVGALKSVTLQRNGTKVSETINRYLHGSESDFEDRLPEYNFQGVIQETFIDAKFVNEYGLNGLITRKYEYPSILIEQENINYLTGMKSKSENKAYDFYSGEVTRVLSTDSYGNRYLSVTEPAYKHYDGMGLKISNSSNKHMLTQTAATYSYKVGADNEPAGLLGASIQTWSDDIPIVELNAAQDGIWRKKASYQWNGFLSPDNDPSYPKDGTYPIADFNLHPFDWTESSNENWEKTGEMALYDKYSHALQASDVNDHFSSVRMDYKHRHVIASASNASYAEMAYSGAEYYAGNTYTEGGVSRGAGSPAISFAHTGAYSLQVDQGQTGFTYILKAGEADLTRKYHASVWVYVPGTSESQELDKIKLYYSINGTEYSVSPVYQKSKSKSWYRMTIDIPANPGNDITVGVKSAAVRSVFFDDFRIHPLDATMSSYVYDSFSGEMNYILDAGNLYTRFEYDAIGRLIRTTREQMNFDFGPGKESVKADRVVTEMVYNYGRNNNE